MNIDAELQSKIGDVIEQCYQQGYKDAVIKTLEWLAKNLSKPIDAMSLTDYQKYMED